MKLLSPHPPELPSVIMTNIRSLRHKVDELSAASVCIRPSLIALSETWLDSSVSDDEVALQNYEILRQDRTATKRGGGVCIFVRNDISYQVLSCLRLSPIFIESLWVYLRTSSILLCMLYIPPNLKAADHQEVLNYVIESCDTALCLHPDSNIIMMGDFNQFPTQQLSRFLDLIPMVDAPTRGNSILDQILISSHLSDDYNKAIAMPNIGKSDHLPLLFSPKEMSPQTKKPDIKYLFDLRETNVSILSIYQLA